MTNIREEDLEEFEYTAEVGLKPGFFSAVGGNIIKGPTANVQMINSACEEYRDYDNQLHRWTGPAIKEINNSGHPNEWYIHGNKLKCNSQEEFIKIRERLLKLKVFW